MAKNKKEKKKPKHSLNANRRDGHGSGDYRSGATVRRLKMYNSRPKRSSKGNIMSHEYQSKALPSTRIQPDPRWFGNTRVISQKELECFRVELQSRMSSNYNVILNEKKLPMSLLNDKQQRTHLLDTNPKMKCNSPKLQANDFEALSKKAASLQVPDGKLKMQLESSNQTKPTQNSKRVTMAP